MFSSPNVLRSIAHGKEMEILPYCVIDLSSILVDKHSFLHERTFWGHSPVGLLASRSSVIVRSLGRLIGSNETFVLVVGSDCFRVFWEVKLKLVAGRPAQLNEAFV